MGQLTNQRTQTKKKIFKCKVKGGRKYKLVLSKQKVITLFPDIVVLFSVQSTSDVTHVSSKILNENENSECYRREFYT